MKKKLVALLVGLVLVTSLPMTAFAGPSKTGNIVDYSDGNVTVSVDYNAVDPGDIDALYNGLGVWHNSTHPELNAVAGNNGHYYELSHSTMPSINGTLGISFDVPGAANGTVFTIYHRDANGNIKTYTATAIGGKVTVAVSELGHFALVPAGGDPYNASQAAANAGSTSPKTGLSASAAVESDAPVVASSIATIVVAAAAVGTVLRVKKSQQ